MQGPGHGAWTIACSRRGGILDLAVRSAVQPLSSRRVSLQWLLVVGLWRRGRRPGRPPSEPRSMREVIRASVFAAPGSPWGLGVLGAGRAARERDVFCYMIYVPRVSRRGKRRFRHVTGVCVTSLVALALADLSGPTRIPSPCASAEGASSSHSPAPSPSLHLPPLPDPPLSLYVFVRTRHGPTLRRSSLFARRRRSAGPKPLA